MPNRAAQAKFAVDSADTAAHDQPSAQSPEPLPMPPMFDFWPALTALAALHLIAAMVPGPNTVVVSHLAAAESRGAALRAVAGVATATGTWVLNTKSTPYIRALKTEFTRGIHEAGVMPADTFSGIRSVYFDGDMNAAPALAGPWQISSITCSLALVTW